MTVAELLEELARLWPKNASQVMAWARRYRDILGRFEGSRLALAWQETLSDWQWDKPPLPAVIVKHVPDAKPEDLVEDKAGGLPFGRDHFGICREMSFELVKRWKRDNAARLDDGPIARTAESEARFRARERAMYLAYAGYREAPSNIRINFTDDDWINAMNRAESQRRIASTNRGGPAKIKARHVPGLFNPPAA